MYMYTTCTPQGVEKHTRLYYFINTYCSEASHITCVMYVCSMHMHTYLEGTSTVCGTCTLLKLLLSNKKKSDPYNPSDTTDGLTCFLGEASPSAALAFDSASAARLPVPTGYCGVGLVLVSGGAGGSTKSPVSPPSM